MEVPLSGWYWYFSSLFTNRVASALLSHWSIIRLEHHAVDDVIVLYKGRVVFWQYIPKKHKRFYMKIYKLCNSLGYTYDMSVFWGKQRQHATAQITATHGMVLQVIRGVEGLGHKIIIDNYFTSPAAKWLTKISIKFSFANWLSIRKMKMWQLVAFQGADQVQLHPSSVDWKYSIHSNGLPRKATAVSRVFAA